MLWKRRHIIGRCFNINNRKIAVWVLIIFLLPTFQLIIPVTKIELFRILFCQFIHETIERLLCKGQYLIQIISNILFIMLNFFTKKGVNIRRMMITK